jgi:hypothetical protein
MTPQVFETDDYLFIVTEYDGKHDFELIFKTGDCAGYSITLIDWKSMTIKNDGNKKCHWRTNLKDCIIAYGAHVIHNDGLLRLIIATQAAMWTVLHGSREREDEEIKRLYRNCKYLCLGMVMYLKDIHLE